MFMVGPSFAGQVRHRHATSYARRREGWAGILEDIGMPGAGKTGRQAHMPPRGADEPSRAEEAACLT